MFGNSDDLSFDQLAGVKDAELAHIAAFYAKQDAEQAKQQERDATREAMQDAAGQVLADLLAEVPITERAALTRAVVDTWLNNMKIVQSLARTYGFQFACYWQPVLYTKERLTPYETNSTELDFNYPGMREFYLETYGQVRQRAEELKKMGTAYDISEIFRDVRDPIYVDFNHMGEKGNTVIARRMAEDFLRLQSAPAPTATGK